MAQFSMIRAPETADLGDDIRVLFEELERTLPGEHRVYSGECRPSLDVLETGEALEITLDVPGVPIEAIRVLFRGGVVLVVGEKAPLSSTGEQTFHLVEREFGRFARVIHVTGAVDVRNAHATLRDGELNIRLPKLDERRGSAHRIPVTTPDERRA